MSYKQQQGSGVCRKLWRLKRRFLRHLHALLLLSETAGKGERDLHAVWTSVTQNQSRMEDNAVWKTVQTTFGMSAGVGYVKLVTSTVVVFLFHNPDV